MPGLFPPGIVAYFARLQEEESFLGLEEFHRRHAGDLRHERTMYRWREQLGDGLVGFPSYFVEPLGLVHVHLFVVGPSRSWAGFAYAVEGSWVLRDWSRPVLYLHLFVPRIHLDAVSGLVHDLAVLGWCDRYEWFVAGPAWQHVRLDAATVRDAVPPAVPVENHEGLLRSCPFVVPAIMESWGSYPSLPRLWERARDHLGTRARSFLPRGRMRLVNGKSHVRDAFLALSDAKLFLQVVLRGRRLATDALEVLVMARASSDRLQELVEALRATARVVEASAPVRGRSFLRVTGGPGVLEVLAATARELPPHSLRVAFVDQGATRRDPVETRFCYEFLLNPKTGTWVFDRDRIMEHLSR